MRLFFVAYFFPPLSQVGYRRPLRLAEHCRKLGHDVTVFSGHPKAPGLGNYSGVDPELTNQIPAGVRVIRAPSLHGFKILIGLRDRLRKKTGSESPDAASSAPVQIVAAPSRRGLKGIVDAVMDLFLIPDVYSGWILTILPRILFERRRGKVDAIYATGAPWSGLVAARLAGILLGIPVYLDYRDPWTFNPYWTAKYKTVNRLLERWVLHSGQCVIVNTVAMQHEFLRAYPELQKRIVTVYNGYELSLRTEMEVLHRERPKAKTEFVVAHVGVLYPTRMPPMLAKTLAAVAATWSGKRPIVFKFVGPVMDPMALTAAFASAGQSGALRLSGEVGVHAARQEEVGADVLLLLYPGSALQVPAKVFEYAFAGNPILTVADAESETASLVLRHGLGPVFTVTEASSSLRAYLEEAERMPRGITAAPASFLEEFDGGKQAGKILEILINAGKKKHQ